MAEEIPAFMAVIVGGDRPAGTRAVAERNLLALDGAMQSIYAEAITRYRATLRATHPVILALFTVAGGELTLYPAGAEAVTAPAMPATYALVKSVAHSAMASFQPQPPICARPAQLPGAGR